jgi:hypothetical protein
MMILIMINFVSNNIPHFLSNLLFNHELFGSIAYKSNYTINYRLIFVISFTSIFINAQSDSFKNNFSFGSKITYTENSSLIITPWNTGNERNNSGAS